MEEIDIPCDSLNLRRIKEENSSYDCETCGGTFPDEMTLKKHLKTAHPCSKIKCNLCNLEISEKSFKRHSKEVHGLIQTSGKNQNDTEWARVEVCVKEQTSDKQNIESESIDPFEVLCKVEMNEETTEVGKNINLSFRGVECKICRQMYSNKINLKKHVYNVHRMVRVKCDVCDKEVNKKSLDRHMKSVHSAKIELKKKKKTVPEEEKIPCVICGKKCSNMMSLQNHVRSIHEAEQFKCGHCDFHGIRRLLEKHLKTKHNDEVHQCPKCQKILKSKTTLKEHMLIHTDDRRFICDICGMRFKRTSNYHGHMKSHQEKKFQCQLCGNFFLRKRYLAIHEQTIHNYYGEGVPPQEKGYQCEVCGVKLKWKNNLLAHMRIHTGEKPYKCKTCGQDFTCHGSLRTHMAKHADVLAKKRLEREEEETLKGEFLGQKFSKSDGSSTSQNSWVFDDFEKVEIRFSPLEAAALSCILGIASLQLYIIDLGTCSTSPDCSNVIARQKIIKVIDETRAEIEQKGTCLVLHEKAKEEAKAIEAAKLLKKSLQDNQARVEDLRAKLKGQEVEKLRDMNEKQEIIASLKDTIHEEITKNDIKLRYVDRWEAAKQSQNIMRCQNAELELEKKLEEITNKCNNESRVHDEICTFLALEEKVLLEEMEKWKETYEREMKRRTEKIKLLEVKKKEQEILRHNLTELYEDREKEINAYLDLKEKLRQEKEHNRLINETATKIQAWWRGTMVRRGLGPFKKKKKPGKEKK